MAVRSLITVSTALVGLMIFISGRAAWAAEQKRRLDAEERLLSCMNRLNTERWDTAIRSFDSAIFRHTEIVANFIEYSDGRTEWTWWGKPAENVRTCEIACRLAGEALVTSAFAKDLPESVLSKPDAADRWLGFIAFKNDFDGPTGNGRDKNGVTHESRSIRDVPSASKLLCEDCRAETLL